MSLQGEYNVVGCDQAVTRSIGNARIALGAGHGRRVLDIIWQRLCQCDVSIFKNKVNSETK